jgi:hypothetical protein
LYFGGRFPESHALIGLARDGLQRVSFTAVAPLAEDAGPGGDGAAAAAVLPDFSVSTTNSAVQVLDSGRLSADSGEATLRGVASGVTKLRVTERSGGELLDRIEVRVAEVSGVDLYASECLEVPRELEAEEATSANLHWARCGAVWAGADVHVGIGLVDASGDTLWDDSLTHDGVAPTGVVDLFLGAAMLVDLHAPLAGEVTLAMVGTSGTHMVTLPVTDEVADIRLRGSSDGTVELVVGRPQMLCAAGVFELPDGSRGGVLGAPAVFVADLPSVILAGADGSEAVGSRNRCRTVTLTERAPTRLRIRMGSMTKAFMLMPMPISTTTLRSGTRDESAPMMLRARSRKPQVGERLSN